MTVEGVNTNYIFVLVFVFSQSFICYESNSHAGVIELFSD